MTTKKSMTEAITELMGKISAKDIARSLDPELVRCKDAMIGAANQAEYTAKAVQDFVAGSTYKFESLGVEACIKTISHQLAKMTQYMNEYVMREADLKRQEALLGDDDSGADDFENPLTSLGNQVKSTRKIEN